jgi:hypothetical protein
MRRREAVHRSIADKDMDARFGARELGTLIVCVSSEAAIGEEHTLFVGLRSKLEVYIDLDATPP